MFSFPSFWSGGQAFSLLRLLLLLSLVCCTLCDVLDPPPVQHHVYYSGSHITSGAIRVSETGAVYAVYVTDVAHNRLVHFNGSGGVVDVWSLTGPDPNFASGVYSPTAVVHMEGWSFDTTVLYVSDSSNGRVLDVGVTTGYVGEYESWKLPEQMWECGLILALDDGGQGERHAAMYAFDRYRGYFTIYDISTGGRKLVGPITPLPRNTYNFTAAYLPAATAMFTERSEDWIFVVDGTDDRVLQMPAFDANYSRVVPLPEDVRGIRAIFWKWCAGMDYTDYGCLWVLYQPALDLTSPAIVISAVVSNGHVMHKWTIGSEMKETQQPTTLGIASSFLYVTGDGVESSPFRVYTAEADSTGVGHTVVVRDVAGVLVQRYESIPPHVDITSQQTHAFSAVQSESESCTLWLTDMENGGQLVRAAPDGSILQYFHTPVLFSSMLLDLTDNSGSLLLLFTNATHWHLWRFSPHFGTFSLLNTTAASQQFDRSSVSEVEYGSVAAVGGMAISNYGIVISLRRARTLVMLSATGERNAHFNASGANMVSPDILTADLNGNIIALDVNGTESRLVRLDGEGALQCSATVTAPMSQPLALMVDQWDTLWVSDANGLIFQMNLVVLVIWEDGIYQPMPQAFGIHSLSMDLLETVYAVDQTTRRLIVLPMRPDSGRYRPSNRECYPYPLQPATASSSSASLISSSSTGATEPDSPPSTATVEVWTLIFGVAFIVELAVLTVLASYCCLRKQGFGGRSESEALCDIGSSDDEPDVYEQWPTPDSVPHSHLQKKADEVEVIGGNDRDSDADSVAESGDDNDGSDADGYDDEDSASSDGSDMFHHESNAFSQQSSSSSDRVVTPCLTRYDVYVRLYEVLSDAMPEHISLTNSNDALSTAPTPSMQASTLYASPTNPCNHPREDSLSANSGSTEVESSSLCGPLSPSSVSDHATLPAPDAIARLSSTISRSALPRFIDEVTDLYILGEGVSGRVYCGHYQGAPVVVKLPKGREMSVAQWREWHAHLRLPGHPNLVSFIGSLVMEDTNYLVLQWVKQGSLKSLISNTSATPTAPWYVRPYGVMRAALDVASALRHIHHHGLVHRDVSTRNVLVDADGTFVLADLGLCQEADTGTSAPPVIPVSVPLRWCSPDYLSTMRYTGKSDVWALGVALWEMTSRGEMPYSEVSDQRWLQQQLESGALSLRVDVTWIGDHEWTDERGLAVRVTRLIDLCLTRNPEQRPSSRQLVKLVKQQMAEWEQQGGKAVNRVKQEWLRDHQQHQP